ncbi:MAG: hypothetical protein M1822_004051 [Bathelium mastoideum]|nr:MAG: hypothetical protein M1822_004051 [Bathelium mastoideum]
MQGQVGSITSTNHPVLGPLLHFTPRGKEALYSGAFDIEPSYSRSKIEGRWIDRTWDVCWVARRHYNSDKRGTARRLDDWWTRHQSGVSFAELDVIRDPQSAQHERRGNHHAGNGYSHETFADDNSRRSAVDNEKGYQVVRRYDQDGQWELLPPRHVERTEAPSNRQRPVVVEEVSNISGTLQAPMTHAEWQEARFRRPTRQPTVEEATDYLMQRVPLEQSDIVQGKDQSLSPAMRRRLQDAKSRQASRSAKVRNIESDRSLVAQAVERGAMPSPYQPKDLAFDQWVNDRLQGLRSETAEPTKAEENARRREEERQKARKERDNEMKRRSNAGARAVELRNVDNFWAAQMAIFQGF